MKFGGVLRLLIEIAEERKAIVEIHNVPKSFEISELLDRRIEVRGTFRAPPGSPPYFMCSYLDQVTYDKEQNVPNRSLQYHTVRVLLCDAAENFFIGSTIDGVKLFEVKSKLAKFLEAGDRIEIGSETLPEFVPLNSEFAMERARVSTGLQRNPLRDIGGLSFAENVLKDSAAPAWVKMQGEVLEFERIGSLYKILLLDHGTRYEAYVKISEFLDFGRTLSKGDRFTSRGIFRFRPQLTEPDKTDEVTESGNQTVRGQMPGLQLYIAKICSVQYAAARGLIDPRILTASLLSLGGIPSEFSFGLAV